MIEVGRYSTQVEADLARMLLESHGIMSFVLDSQMSNFFGGAIIPVRLLVDEDDAPEAITILAPDRPA